MKNKSKIFILALPLLLIACGTPSELTPMEFAQWTQADDNGLVEEKVFDEMKMRLKYRPLEEVLLARGLKDDSTVFNQALAANQGALHFSLRLESLRSAQLLELGLENTDQYPARIYYFTTQLVDDLALVVDQDTVPCALAHFERTYGAASYNDIAISFVPEFDVMDKDLEFIYHDRVFGHGVQRFIIESKDRLAVPKIKFS